MGDELGGHLVSGHVDGVGEALSATPENASTRWVFRVPTALARFIAVKGSVAVDGVSLTVNEVTDDTFGVNIIPHTAAVTGFGSLAAGRCGEHRDRHAGPLRGAAGGVQVMQNLKTVELSQYLSAADELIEEARNGRMFILVDDEDRENEGDLVIPAQFATPDAINFMARHARGLICLALTRQRVEQLGLPLMSAHNGTRHQTAFTVSIEAREGVTTGISAHDRAHTIAVAINPECGRDDIVTPGHVFPLMAREGGTLVRAGHTEASVDIARKAGLYPAAVICEIMNDDGTMARLPDLVTFAQRHNLKLGSIADLIAHRRLTERLVKRVAEGDVPPRRRRRLARRGLCQHGRVPGASGAGEGRRERPGSGDGAHARGRSAGRHDRRAALDRRAQRDAHDRPRGPRRGGADPRAPQDRAGRTRAASCPRAARARSGSCATTASARRSCSTSA